jgi:hypothetical protein
MGPQQRRPNTWNVEARSATHMMHTLPVMMTQHAGVLPAFKTPPVLCFGCHQELDAGAAVAYDIMQRSMAHAAHHGRLHCGQTVQLLLKFDAYANSRVKVAPAPAHLLRRGAAHQVNKRQAGRGTSKCSLLYQLHRRRACRREAAARLRCWCCVILQQTLLGLSGIAADSGASCGNMQQQLSHLKHQAGHQRNII